MSRICFLRKVFGSERVFGLVQLRKGTDMKGANCAFSVVEYRLEAVVL